jgi:hypothetical protein
MFPYRSLRATVMLIILLGVLALGCNDSSGGKKSGDTPVSPQSITLPGPGNPFRPDTEIVFVMPQSGRWSASITSIFSDTVHCYCGTAVAGETVWIVWEGDDDHGAPQPDGIYFARVTAGRYQFTKKLLLIWRP